MTGDDTAPDATHSDAVRVEEHDTPDDVAIAAAAIIADALRAAIDARGSAVLALSGGSTPRPAYARLAAEYRDDVDWARVTFVYGDDRCVPADHEHSNHRMVEAALLSRLPVAGERVHRIRGELSPADAADDYERTLRATLGERGDGVLLDVNVMGIGPDGHTASHFPNAPSLDEQARWVVHTPAPTHVEPHLPRVTLTLPALRRAELVLFLATGGDKPGPLRRALTEPPSAATPASLVRGARETRWLLDAAAARALDGTGPAGGPG